MVGETGSHRTGTRIHLLIPGHTLVTSSARPAVWPDGSPKAWSLLNQMSCVSPSSPGSEQGSRRGHGHSDDFMMCK